MTGPCEHCHNPDKSKWLSDCKYKGSFPSRRAFVLSTFDPPCSCDAYDEGRAEFTRDGNRKLALAIFVSIIALIALASLLI